MTSFLMRMSSLNRRDRRDIKTGRLNPKATTRLDDFIILDVIYTMVYDYDVPFKDVVERYTDNLNL